MSRAGRDAGNLEWRTAAPGATLSAVTVTGIITAIIIGAIIGALGRLILPGKQPIGWILTIVVGILAAILGTILANALGWETEGTFNFGELLLQILLAVVGVAIVAGTFRGGSRNSLTR
jgi:uncharacterized membrane protein YeaQ/YmgE (transglycosylase-associated protein family)